jgi:WD40 repeat protein
MLAAAYPRAKSNHYQINIYDSFTLEHITTLKGHTHQVTEIIWGPKDSFIATCGIDGGIYEWNTIDWGRKEFALNSNKYHSMIYDTPIGMLLAAGTETLKDHKNNANDDKKAAEERSVVRELRTSQANGQGGHTHDLGM